jgi:hypothetical protein
VRTPRRLSPLATLLAGLALLGLAELLLGIDVARRGGVIVPRGELADPAGWLEVLARQVAINMTPICWVGYMLVLDGLLALGRGGSPLRRRPRLVLLCALTSIPIWLWFDWINFSVLDAWRYHGLPENPLHRHTGYAVAFGAIDPAMFVAAALGLRLGLRHVRGPGLRVPLAAAAVVGAVFVVIPFAWRDPAANLTLWLGPFLLLDPLNARLGGPSILLDWRAGRYGRTLALMAGGLTCGLLWEFWNFWAATKWTYNLPFLGGLEGVRYFEMPVLGLLGFLPFGVSCWVMFVTALLGLRRVGVRGEPLPEGEVL